MSPCIVFLDEVDSLFGARSSQSSGGAQAHRQILTGRWREVRMKETCTYLLEIRIHAGDGRFEFGIQEQRTTHCGDWRNQPTLCELSAFEGKQFLISFVQDLDEAVLRRLPRRLLVDLPGQTEREAILRILLKNEKLAEDVDLKKIAEQTDTYSGSDLKRESEYFIISHSVEYLRVLLICIDLCVSAALASLKENVHLPWKAKTTSWVPASPGGEVSAPAGPSSPAYQQTLSPAEIEEPEMPNEALPQPQMQRFRQRVQRNNVTNLVQWNQPSPQTVLQQAIKVQVTPLHIHGLASSIGTLAYETSLSSRQNRSSDDQEYVSKPRLPARSHAQAPEASNVEVIQQAPVKVAPAQRRRKNHVDELLQTSAYDGLKVPGEIVNLLRERLYRMATFYVLSQGTLRSDVRLLSLIQETIYLDMRSLTSRQPHDLAVRLGWTKAGAQRGPAREALHQTMVIQQGRLPSLKQVEQAVMEDRFDPHGRFDIASGSNNVFDTTTITVMPEVKPSTRTAQDSTMQYNQQLHDQIIGGAKVNQIRKDGQKAVRHSRPTGGLHQLSALLQKIQELKRDRGFQPDFVTLNLVVKTWLRGLAAGPQKSPFGAEDIFKAFKRTLTMDSVKKQNLDFDRDIQPLVKMLVKALKTNGEWLKAREVLAWMAEIRETIAAQAESRPQHDIDGGKPKSKGSQSQTETSKGAESNVSASISKSALRINSSKSDAPQAAPTAPASTERTISMKHFEIAMKEITPSSSETGNLPELRKVSSVCHTTPRRY